jgi:hypothetical protein
MPNAPDAAWAPTRGSLVTRQAGPSPASSAARASDPEPVDGEAVGVFLARNSVEPIGEGRATGEDGETSLLDIAKRHAFDPSVFEESPPYFWRALISNSMLDAYYTRMHSSSLKNYAADAADGVSFQNSHTTRQLGVGRSLTGRFTGGSNARVEADFYTVPGIRLNSEIGTDDFIRGVRSGLIHDVSIGFYGGEYRCSVCSRDMLRDWDCWHIPGVRYDKEGKRDPEGEVAIAWIHDARLSEVSAVYDGATPGAAIVKAQREAEAGRIRPDDKRLVEVRYRIHLPDKTTRVVAVETEQPTPEETDERAAGAPPETETETETEAPAPVPEPDETPEAPADAETDPEGRAVPAPADDAREETRMTGQPNPTPAPTQEPAERMLPAKDAVLLVDIRAMLKPLERDGADDPLAAVREVVDELVRIRPEAEDGRAYRASLIESALEEGVRAFGNEFDKTTYTGVLEKSSIQTIIRFRDDWAKAARAPGGLPAGRQTADVGAQDAARKTAVGSPVPDYAFRAG